jgi:hypothetical protein
MMLRPSLNRASSLGHIKIAFGCTVAAAVILCAYAVWTSIVATQRAAASEQSLQERRAELVQLTAEAKNLQGRQLKRLTQSSTGVVPFAVQMAQWAKSHQVLIEALAPDGEPQTETVTFKNAALGQWSINRVNIHGEGQLERVTQVLKELSTHGAASRLESFSLQALDEGRTGKVEFQIVVIVYQKKVGEA